LFTEVSYLVILLTPPGIKSGQDKLRVVETAKNTETKEEI
jgi:hypothetical protein